MESGSELIKASIKKKAIGLTVVGAILLLIGLFMITMMAIGSSSDNDLGIVYLFFGVIAVVGILFIAVSVTKIAHPEVDGMFKKNPNLLAYADELYKNPIIDNKFLTVSDRLIGSRRFPTVILKREDVVWAYTSKTSYNFVTTTNMILVKSFTECININVYGVKKDILNDIYTDIDRFCPNARLGYTAEDLQWFNAEQKKLKKSSAGRAE